MSHPAYPSTPEDVPTTATAAATLVSASLARDPRTVPLRVELDPQSPSAEVLELPASTAEPGTDGVAPKKVRAKRWTPESLAAHRQLKRRIKHDVKLAVDNWFSRAEAKTFEVNYLAVQATGQLTAAAAMQAISVASEQQMVATGDPYVAWPQMRWLEVTGMAEDEWVQARMNLREQGFVLERRRFDLDLDEIVVDLAFDFEAWSQRLAEIRQQAADHFQFQLERDAGLLRSRLAD